MRPNGGSAARLTAKERILLHLWDFGQYSDAIDVPLGMTQDGLARGTWIEDRHVVQYVRPLIKEGLVRERMAHVRSSLQRRKVYDLTELGKTAAVRLREEVKSEIVRVRDSSGTREAKVGQLVQEAGGRASLLEIVRQAQKTGSVDLTAWAPGAGAASEVVVPDAVRLAGEYNWLGAAEAYRSASHSMAKEDLIGQGLLRERAGYCLHRAALQAGSVEEFVNRVDKAVAEYANAKQAYAGGGRPEAATHFQRCDAMLAYLAFWRATEPAEKRRMAETTWVRTKETLNALRANGDSTEFGRTYNDLVTSVDFSNAFEWDFSTKETKVREAVEYGEEAIRCLASGGNPSELARAHAKTSWYLFHLSFRQADREESRRYSERALSHQRQAMELSKDVALLESPWFETEGGTGFETGTDAGLARFRSGVDCARRTNDRFQLGFALAWLAYHSGWRSRSVDDPSERLITLANALRYAEEARTQLSRVSLVAPELGSYWPEAPSLSHNVLMARGETNPDRKREFLEQALAVSPEAIRRAERCGYPYSVGASHFYTSWAGADLAQLEMNRTRKQTLLEEARAHLDESIRVGEQVEPGAFWELGAQQHALARIKWELANLAGEPAARTRLLEEAIGLETRASKLLAQGAFSAPLFGDVGDLQYEHGTMLTALYQLTSSREALLKAAETFEDAAEWFNKSDLASRVAECHWKAAHTYDSLGDHRKASEKFAAASESYKVAAERIPQLKELYEDHALYMQAWSEIEKARHHHGREEYGAARDYYERAATLHAFSRRRKSLAMDYAAWAEVEGAEDLSRGERSAEAIASFGHAGELFRDAKASLQAGLNEVQDVDERRVIEEMIGAAENRQLYCAARAVLEEARLLDKKGEYSSTCARYGTAAEGFERLAGEAKSDRDRRDLTLIATLARAWQALAKAEAEASPQSYAEAAEFFRAAKDLSSNERTKALALGHGQFCQALEAGDQFVDTRDPTFHASAVRHLDSAASYYARAGAESASEYARASRLLFDAYAATDRAGLETNPTRRAKGYVIAEQLLRASADAFGNAEQPGKKAQVLRLLDGAKRQRELATSLTDVLHAPLIVSSTAAFATPEPSYEQAVGLDRFEHADIRASIVLPQKSPSLGEDFELTLELVNAGRTAGQLIKVEGLIPQGFELVAKPEKYEVEDNFLDLRGKQLGPLRTEKLIVVLRPVSPGVFSLRPRIMFLDESGNYRSHEPDPTEVVVKRSDSPGPNP